MGVLRALGFGKDPHVEWMIEAFRAKPGEMVASPIRPSSGSSRRAGAEMALKLGATFRTTPGFWLNAQKAVDLHLAAKRIKELPKPLLRAS